MQEVLLVVHLMLAIAIVITVVLQRSEGGALGMGGGGGGGASGGLMTGREAANLLTRSTAVLAACFFATSLTLTVLAGHSGEQKSILEQSETGGAANQPVLPAGPSVPTDK